MRASEIFSLKRECNKIKVSSYFADDETVRNIRVTRLAEDVFQADFGIPTSFDPDMEFACWAPDPNLLDPNVFEGETPMMELTEVYAIWRERE